jgi:tRNA(Ile)-lysidine synthase
MSRFQRGKPPMPVAAEPPFPARYVEDFLARHDLLQSRGGLLVAFSGGPDSTALLWSLSRVSRRYDLPLFAAHLDHGLDRASSARAARARALAAELDVAIIEERLTETHPASGREGLEAAARRLRYDFLRRAKRECGADWIAVGHHRDDQLETVVLRLLFGSGITGLGAMSPITGDVVRPLLDLGREDLSRAVARLGLTPAHDPGNDDPQRPRNQVRRWLLPALRRQPGFSETVLLAAAAAARRASRRLRRELGARLEIRRLATDLGAELELGPFRELSEPLRPYALDALRRAAGAEYAAPAAARRDLDRQIESSARVGCDCGAGWFWESSHGRLRLTRRREPEELDFSYTLRVPGELSIPEVGLDFRLTESRPAPWMYRGSKSRAAMLLPLETGQKVLIRNRRPGDRLRPLGCRHERKLKDLLIDRRVERARRDALPLLLVEGRIAWVPGITIDDTFRLKDQRPADDQHVWVAELRPHPTAAH